MHIIFIIYWHLLSVGHDKYFLLLPGGNVVRIRETLKTETRFQIALAIVSYFVQPWGEIHLIFEVIIFEKK